MLLQHLNVVFRHIAARLFVPVRTPVQIGKVHLERAQLFSRRVNDLDTGVDYFRPDTIGTDLSDLVYILTLGCGSVRVLKGG